MIIKTANDSFDFIVMEVQKNLKVESWKRPSSHLTYLKKEFLHGKGLPYIEKEIIKHFKYIKKNYYG
tara:strand:+ start:310 stop:510 length:201 start_codon:yes stop_codon:yes gene_type:complete